MPFNVPEEEKPAFNKKVQESLGLLAQDIGETLSRVQSLQPQTLVDAYNQPVQAPVTRDLTPLEQYVYEPQPVQEVAEIAAAPPRESMVAPQEQPQVLSNFRNQAEAQFGGDMVSITPEQQAVTDVIGAEIDSLRNDAGEIASSPLEVFSKPLDANKVKALGFVDADGNVTDKGELFFNLKESGAFNEDGTINKKGIAYLTPLEDMQDISGEWVNKPENREIFDTLWKDGLIRTSGSLGEIGVGVVDLLKKGVMSLPEGLSQGAQATWYNSQTWPSLIGRDDRRPQELRDKMVASEYGIYEEFVRGVIGLSGMAGIAKAKTKSVLSGVLPQEVEDEADQDLVRARYDLWNAQQNYINKDAGELAETILNIDGAVKQVDEVKSRIGKDEFNKQYGQGAAFQQLFLSPENLVTANFAVKAATSAPMATRVGLTAQRRLGNIATQEMAIAQGKVAVAEANALLKKEAASVNVANRLAADISTRAGANPELVARANQASQVATRLTEEASKIRATLPAITSELDNLVAKRNSLATRIPEAYSQKVLQTMELGRQMRAMPAKAVGATLERVGDTISKTDTAVTNFLQERGLDQMYTAAVGAAGVVGLAGNPIIGALGAGAAALKTGKVLSNYGKLFRYVGKEMENVRGQIPFWKRVAAHTAPGSLSRGFAHTFNMMDLGGVTSDTIRRASRGIAAAAPTDLMFEYLSDGADMRPETLYQAGVESFFIGGSFAGAGGAFMGTKKRMRELSNNDQLNFLRDLTDTRQKALFQAIPEGTRRAISTYAIANPTLNYIFKDSGASRYDPNTNTAVINVKSTNPIKALVAHETLHHTVIKNNMEPGISALFLGDTKNNTVGGLFRSRDGKLDPNFEAFRDGYYKRLGVEGMSNAERDAIYPLDKIAVEYFIEKHADQYAAMAESGELGAVAASGAARRKLGSILETVLPRIPVLKDLHFKSGGMIDKNGAWVTGNGILDAEGVKRDPITSKMFRDMNRRSAGLVPGQFDPLMSDKPDSGAPILLNPADGIDAELLHPLVQVDDTNKPIMKDGKPVALDRATELSRALAGLTAKEVLQRKRSENYAPEKGEAHIDDEGQFQPGWLSNDVLTEMFAKNKYNPEQKRIIREMNKLIRKGAGDRVVMINFPATTRNKAGKVVYKPQGATLRDTVPVAVTISKDGNLLFGLMSVTKLHENIQKRSQSKRGKKLYGGNVDLILRDTQAMMDYHKQGLDSIEFFKQKYGAVEADERKKFINTMFGLLNQKEQAVLNPILLEDGVKSRDNVYRTYRADRVSKAVPMSPEEYPAMPFSYEAVSAVRMPEQLQMPEAEVPAPSTTRLMPEKIDADYMKAVESGDVETQQRIVDEVAKKAEFDPNPIYRGRRSASSNIKSNVPYFTFNEQAAQAYAQEYGGDEGVVLKAYSKFKNTATEKQVVDIARRINYQFVDESFPAAYLDVSPKLVKALKEEGFDSVEGRDSLPEDQGEISVVAALYPEDQIKSADPITRDDSGNIIPPSKRFDITSKDLRFMPEKADDGANLKLLQTKETLKDWAITQESWKDWYSEHQETLDDFFGDYAGLFQEILAVTSQAASVKANVGLGLKAFGQLMRNEEFDGKLRGEEKSGYLPAVIKNLNAIKNKTQVGGRKISNYKSANEGDSSRVVVDRHIARMLFGVDTPSAKQYAKAESVLSEVAKEIGWEPSQVQAALWAQSIVMSGKEPVSYGAYLKSLEAKKLTKKELISGLKGNQLTRRIGQIAGSSYGRDESSKKRGRYSPPSKNTPKRKTGVVSSGNSSAIANAANLK